MQARTVWPDDPDGDPMTDDATAFDQRGGPYGRVADGDVQETVIVDIGAYEAQAVPEALPGDYNRNGVADSGFVIAGAATRILVQDAGRRISVARLRRCGYGR